MALSDFLATLGVSLLLAAFILNHLGKIRVEGLLYGVLNIFGAGLCAVSAVLIRFYPFVVLESVWVLVGIFVLLKNVPRGTASKKGR